MAVYPKIRFKFFAVNKRMKKQFYEWIFFNSWAGKLLNCKYKKVCYDGNATPVPMIFFGNFTRE
jgi:hypothetical protein